MEKYTANCKAHRKGMAPEEVAEYYTTWAENQQYDLDLDPSVYMGPSIVAKEAAKCFEENREKVRLIDIACGTGRVGKELSTYGFKSIDGVDPAEGMLKQCQTSHIYTNLYKEFVCEKPLPIAEGTYDCAVCSGGFGEGHIPCSGLQEMARIVKSGGLIIFMMRKEYMKDVEEYANKLEPMISRLEHEHTWELLERREVANYSFNKDGVIFKLRIKRGCHAENITANGTERA
ncbi:methyltransferase-like protein 27 isoform X2 [Dreissena polymorpha]|nr:methyltransferase-like protein 27 isoform X2 [Dreissena polymorpha]XP_052279197.1 methyltransferase-like protein 27 isoform X2 [Dreissena polymorpha]XP_052279198.1 methyltransferase-like protein 27 isoform X2 [Dreissena polymorpha]XP_052279199.1 methyltransferase-like protein 27 isoform X2 [Dreissena polymorpha]XP_052279200.1 methyltransferase-like protein 27 isoform X2 [Dreissena polymorpha]XP_052279201.1 methyltransferase-like protein 27 isoform X2 [Dreissena polymorpha]XP_052279202.1 me